MGKVLGFVRGAVDGGDDDEEHDGDESGHEEPPSDRENIDWTKLSTTTDAKNQDLPNSDAELSEADDDDLPEPERSRSDDDPMEEPDGHKRLLAMGAGDGTNPDMPE